MTCARCGVRPAMDGGELCVPCEYARIKSQPADALWNPTRSLDVAESWFKLHG